MRIGLTGGRGFIGGAVKRWFEGIGAEVIDYNCRLTVATEVERCFLSSKKPDVFIHLAGRFSGNHNILIQDNLVSTMNVLRVLSDHSPNVHFIYASSGAGYGNSGNDPIREDHLCRPNTEYGLVKSLSEQAVKYYGENFNLAFTTLRLPSVYGESNSKGLIFNWLQAALSDEGIVINGNGLQRRSFIDVRDVCSAIGALSQNKVLGTFNLTHSNHWSINALAEAFVERFNVTLRYEPANNSLESMVLDPSNLLAASGWSANYDLMSFLDNHNFEA